MHLASPISQEANPLQAYLVDESDEEVAYEERLPIPYIKSAF